MERPPPPCDLSDLPDDVQSYLAALRDALLAALGVEQVLQIYLVGSASYPSGYISGRSDLDVAVVTRTQLDQVALSRIPELCSHGALPCPADKLELVIYAYEAIHGRTALPYDISLNYNTGRALPRDHIRFGNNPDDSPHWFILDIAAAHAHNVALLARPDFAEVFTPQLEPQQVLDALLMSLRWHMTHEPTSANAVLNACRAWRWSDEGVFGSKTEGGDFALSRLSDPAAQVVRSALAFRMSPGAGAGSGETSKEAAGDLYGIIASALGDGER